MALRRMDFCSPFWTLLWKNWLLRKHHYVVTILEILLPVFLSCILLYIASTHSIEYTKETLTVKMMKFNATYYPRTAVNNLESGARGILTGKLLFAPNTSFTEKLMKKAFSKYIMMDIKGFDSEYAIEAEVGLDPYSKRYEAVVFSDIQNNEFPTTLKYKLRPSPLFRYATDKIHHSVKNTPRLSVNDGIFKIFGPNESIRGLLKEIEEMLTTTYMKSGFLTMQAEIDLAYAKLCQEEMKQPVHDYDVQIYTHSMPYPSHSIPFYLYNITEVIIYMVVYGFVVLCPVIVKRIVEEKANRTKEMMKLMGMDMFTYWGSTFISNFLLMVVICGIITMLYKIEVRTGVTVLSVTSGSLFFVILLLYSVASILFCFIITTFFNRAMLAIMATLLLWTGSFAIPAAVLTPEIRRFYILENSFLTKLITCLSPNMALHWIIQIMSAFNSIGNGAQWDNIFEPPYKEFDDFSLAYVMGMLMLDCVIFIILLWYLDAVWPWQPGVPKSPLFCFFSSHWIKKSQKTTIHKNLKNCSAYFEEEPANLTPSIILSHLTKVFTVRNTKKTAVDDLSLNILPGQITALLGQNGAGKSTVVNMITGMLQPTKGSAIINGHDIITETAAARKNLGLCLQDNAFYDILTVEEHLKFYGGLKGMSLFKTNEEITKLLDLLQLQEKRYTSAKSLSGGMKRKLSLGISIIGGSQVLILDEPTSGLDPEARRIIWDVLLHMRRGHTILLTTHHMEEADILGDRIAIMANGSIKCYGSPIFLKGKFGTGYHLHVAKKTICNVPEITRLIKHHVPEASLVSNISLALTYSLSNTTQGYSVLFENLEKSYSTLGIASCGITVTTMEDVFLRMPKDLFDVLLRYVEPYITRSKSHALPISAAERLSLTLRIGHICESELYEKMCINNTKPLPEFETNEDSKLSCPSKLTGLSLFIRQVKSLFMKRIQYMKHHGVLLIFQIIIPLIAFTMLIVIDYQFKMNLDEKNKLKPLNLDLNELYGETNGFYHMENVNEVTNSLANYYENLLKQKNADVINITEKNDPEQYFLERGEKDVMSFVKNDLVAVNISADARRKHFIFTSWFNSVPYHVDPISINLITTAFLRFVTKNENLSIQVVNQPLSYYIQNETLSKTIIIITYSISVTLGLAFISSSFVMLPIHERVSKAKLMQQMCGVSGIMFWIVNLLWDYFIYILCSIVILIPFFVYAVSTSYMEIEAVGVVFLILVMYGLSSIPITYLVSFIPNVPSSGFALLTVLNSLCGILLSITIAILKQFPRNIDQDSVNSSMWYLRFLPTFAANWGISKIRMISEYNTQCELVNKNVLKNICSSYSASQNQELYKCCTSEICRNECFKKQPLLGWDDVQPGKEILFLGISGLIYFSILILLETILPKLWYRFTMFVMKSKHKIQKRQSDLINMSEDFDVIDEYNRVKDLFQQGHTKEEALIVIDLTKNFNSICAVDDLTFSVHRMEFFGLLGINGAGKTTTFRMLAGDLMPTYGNAYIGDYDIQKNLEKFQVATGYCPQSDALIDHLTGREMLTLFANLRGVQQGDIKFVVNRMLKMCNLDEYADKLTKTYSGGTKRKLSLGLALIGAPPIILLDEPTAGVDPVSRRKIWETLIIMKKLLGLSFILTSHSLDECEALCDRISIMVNGKFCCMGSVQHLKSKFGQGFTVVAKINKASILNSDAMPKVKTFIETSFPSAVLKDAHQGILHYHVTDVSEKWSKLFSVMEEAKAKFHLDDYLVSDTTLEQIFLAFARAQIECNQ